MKKLYLTIDDAPSGNTKNIVDFLNYQGIQALFFCRGDRMAMFPDSIDYILKCGHQLGAHGLLHRKASMLSIDEFKKEIVILDRRIAAAYERNGIERRKYFRFPYFDKGSGTFPCDPAKLTAPQITRIKNIMLDLRPEAATPSPEQLRHKDKCQSVLEREGYAPCDIRDDVWDDIEELKNDRDVGASIVTADWKLLPRHRKQYGMTVEMLCAKMERNLQGRGTAIVLSHDYDDYGEAFGDFCKITAFLQSRGDFLHFPRPSLDAASASTKKRLIPALQYTFGETPWRTA